MNFTMNHPSASDMDPVTATERTIYLSLYCHGCALSLHVAMSLSTVSSLTYTVSLCHTTTITISF